MGKTFLLIISLIAVIGISLYVLRGYTNRKTQSAGITSYEECVAAGYPVQEKYPPVCTVGNGISFIQDIGNELDLNESIVVNSPRPNTRISSPLTIEGLARGAWFFEGTFPVSLTDGNGQSVSSGTARAEGEWMTDSFVPFTATVSFPIPDSAKGALLLRKDNPSGLPENDQVLKIPITFQ